MPPYTVSPTAVGAADGGPGNGRCASVNPVLASTATSEKPNVAGTSTPPHAQEAAGQQVQAAAEVIIDHRRRARVGTVPPHLRPIVEGDRPNVFADVIRRGLVVARARTEEHEPVVDVHGRRTPHVSAA